MDIRITSICARSGGEETEICFVLTSPSGEHSSRESFIISSSRYLTLNIEIGVSDEEQYDTVSREAEVWSATKKALFLLGYGSCSEKALKIKLVSKGFDKEIAAKAVQALSNRGLLRENDDAVRVAEKMLCKLWGKKRIISGLYEKGYSAEAVSNAINALENNEVDFVANCKKLIDTKYSFDPNDKQSVSKVFSALMRYGYTASEIKQAMCEK
jgi:SOS response regulatory protein OraA/RecX